MSKLGLISSKFDINSRSLKEFDESLLALKEKKYQPESSELKDSINKILKIVKPISESVRNNLTTSAEISENSIILILKERHGRNWSEYQESILNLGEKFTTPAPSLQLTEKDFQLLEDIADALDAECEFLFQRMNEGR
ncbi:MAG: hypothetical protein JSV88_01565 [Candidatus Aminicenantes bacterium]|nr:MAG: hypothetical protein JSV88_01565 [Candidatus Aminicenantes bacterium]